MKDEEIPSVKDYNNLFEEHCRITSKLRKKIKTMEKEIRHLQTQLRMQKIPTQTVLGQEKARMTMGEDYYDVVAEQKVDKKGNEY